jgi:hypothetical protein
MVRDGRVELAGWIESAYVVRWHDEKSLTGREAAFRFALSVDREVSRLAEVCGRQDLRARGASSDAGTMGRTAQPEAAGVHRAGVRAINRCVISVAMPGGSLYFSGQ